MSLTANSSFQLEGRTPIEQVTGETPNISEYLDFSFYDWVQYRDNAGVGDNMFGVWLGVSHRIGNLMSDWILTSRTTVQRVTNLEIGAHELKQQCMEYDKQLADIMKDDNHTMREQQDERQLQDWDDHTEDNHTEFAAQFNGVISNSSIPEVDETFTPDTFHDTYLNKEVALTRGVNENCDVQFGKVTKRLCDAEGRPIGTANENPLIDRSENSVEFKYGISESLSANIIARNLYSQIDEEGNRHILLEDIIDHWQSNGAIDKDDAFIMMKNGVKRRCETTKGWHMLCQWKDGSTNWVALKDAKHSYPVLVAEYAIANQIDEEPAFAWWVGNLIRKRNRILSKIKSKYWQRTHKFGIRIPKSVEKAIAIDKQNGNSLWWDAICTEMKNVRPAFEMWEQDEKELPLWGTRESSVISYLTLRWARTSDERQD